MNLAIVLVSLTLLATSCASARSNASWHEERSQVRLAVFEHREEFGGLGLSEAALGILVQAASKAIEWEASKYEETSKASFEGSDIGLGVRQRTPRLPDRAEALFFYLRTTTPEDRGFWETLWDGIRFYERPTDLEPLDADLLVELAQAARLEVQEATGRDVPAAYVLAGLLGFGRPGDEALTRAMRSMVLAQDPGTSQSRHSVLKVIGDVLTRQLPTRGEAGWLPKCKAKGNAATMRECVDELQVQTQKRMDPAPDIQKGIQHAICPGKTCNPIDRSDLEELLVPFPIATVVAQNKYYFSLAAAGWLKPRESRDLFELHLLGYRYSSVRAKNLYLAIAIPKTRFGWRGFGIPFTDWAETESALEIAISGPGAARAHAGRATASRMFKLEWDRDTALEGKPSRWISLDDEGAGSSTRTHAYSFPDLRDLSIYTTLNESGDIEEALEKLAEEVGKID